VAPRPGYPRIVPYNPEAGEHVIGFQPADDLGPCRWYEVDTTDALIDARGQAVTPAVWRFQTSGCQRPSVPPPIRGTLVCDATATVTFPSGLITAPNAKPAHGRVDVELTDYVGGQTGGQRMGSSLPIAGGVGDLRITLDGSSCTDLTQPSGPARIRGRVRWRDAHGKEIGTSSIDADEVDPRGDMLTVTPRARVFPSHALAWRIALDVGGCGAGGRTTLTVSSGKITVWP